MEKIDIAFKTRAGLLCQTEIHIRKSCFVSCGWVGGNITGKLDFSLGMSEHRLLTEFFFVEHTSVRRHFVGPPRYKW